MTPLRLADRFRLARRPVVLVDDERVRASFGLPVPAGATLRIRRRYANPGRPQGLRLRAAVDLAVGDVRARDLTLWSTSAPDDVEVLVDAATDTIVHLWNVWWAGGVTHAWLGDAGFLVETDLTADDPRIVLWCSDGTGGVTFDDLVVEVEIRVAAPSTDAATPATDDATGAALPIA